MTTKPPIRVDSAPEFDQEVKQLAKKYRGIRRDVEPFTQRIERGDTPGDRMQEFAPYAVYKARVANRDTQRGKSGGYRIIYYIRTAENVILLFIYTKTEQEDVSSEFLRRVIEDYEEASPAPDTPDFGTWSQEE